MAPKDHKLIKNEKSHLKSYRICCAPGCRSNFTSDEEPVQTFSFPKDKILRKKWLLAIKADRKYKLIAPQICIKHFEEHFLLRQVTIQNTGHETMICPNGKVQLLTNAIPTVFFNEQSLHCTNNKYPIFFGKKDIEYTFSKIKKTDNFCRICLASNIRLTTLATVRKISANDLEVENSKFGKLFEYLFSIKTSDLPKWLKICFLCQNQIELFFKFRKQALQIHRNLMSISKNANLMHALCNTQKKYFVNEHILNSNYDDSSVIDDGCDQTTIRVFKDQFMSDNEYKKSRKNSNLSNLNQEICLSSEVTSPNFEYSEKYSRKMDIINHTKQQNKESLQCSNKIVYVCEYCSKEFFNQKVLFSHRKEHYGKFENFVIKCSNCGDTFNDRNHFTRHKILCNKKNQKYFKCRYCLKKIFKYKAFQNHLQNHKIAQNTGITIYNREINSNYNNLVTKKYKASNKNVKEKCKKDRYQKKDVTCKLCNFNYETEKLFQQHLYHDHLINYKFKCPYSTCKISFLNEFYLENHVKDHQNPDKQKFLNDINEKILEYKITSENINSYFPKNDQETVSSDERKCIKKNVKNEIGGEYEIVLQELNSSFSCKEINGNSLNYVELKKNEEEVEYFKERDTLASKNGNIHLIYNQHEDRMFEIDINPEFY